MQIIAELKFKKIRQIGVGQGLNSKVYLAHDPQLNTDLAVKEIDKTTFWNPKWFEEAQTVYSVAHPNVVSVQYGCELGNQAFVAMPFYASGSLADRLQAGPVSLFEISRLGQGILQGLAHIHSSGYVHLDLKPSNVLFDDIGRPLVADFGQARALGPAGIVKAPPLYRKSLPPEVLSTGHAVVQSDIYQIGILLYRAVNGEESFSTQLARFRTDTDFCSAVAREKFPDRQAFLPHVPKPLRTLIRKALRSNPLERFDSATSLADALGRIHMKKDWSVEIDSSGEMKWSTAAGCPTPLSVELRNSRGGWGTEVYTNGTTVRARGRGELWRLCPSRSEALNHLKRVFEQL
jgi:serine/threonine protein kinase